MFIPCVFVLFLLALTPCASGQNISVITLQLQLDVPLTIEVTDYVEYILEYTPAEGGWGAGRRGRLRVHSEGGQVASPLLLVLRHQHGAQTWQLPYKSGDQILYDMERTLCATDSPPGNDSTVGGAGWGAERAGWFSVHASGGGRRAATLLLHAARLALPPHTDTAVQAHMWSAGVLQYWWGAAQRGVLLQARSPAAVCGSVVLLPAHQCPVEEFISEVSLTTLRMSMLESGGVHVERSRFPDGFLIVSMVYPDDVVCTGVEPEDEAWLWEDAVLSTRRGHAAAAADRTKTFIYNVDEAPTPREYVLWSAATLLLLLLVYAAAGALLLLRRLVPGRETADVDQSPAVEPTTGRRRNSGATLDNSDNSDTDSEEEYNDSNAANNRVVDSNGVTDSSTAGDRVVVVVNNTEPDGVAAQDADQQTIQDTHQEAPPLRLATLARRRERTLRARAARYPPLLLTVCVFYALPALQLLAALQLLVASTGSLDACYYNFLCAWRAGALHDLNHVVSNAAYLLLGALLLLQLRRRRRARAARPPPPAAGIPDHDGLLAALALAMMAVSLMSAAYHVCPNRLSFQFDTSFMYVLAVLMNVKLYQARHPDVNARAHATFAALAVLIALAVWGVLGGGPLFWALFSVLHVFGVLLLSVQLYYVGQFKFEAAALAAAARWRRPRYVARFAAIAAGNVVNWALAIFGLVGGRGDFASHLLSVVLCNALLHMGYYLLMKRLHGERLRWSSAAVTAAAAAAWLPALYLFFTGNSDWSVPAAQSRRRNHRCLVLFYDAHDLWHLLSAAALYLSLCAMLSWDDGLAATPRHRIPVF